MAILWVWLAVITATIAIYVNYKKIKRGNIRNPLRTMAIIMASYIGGVYFLFGVGVIEQAELNPILRWFWSTIMVYLIAEGQNG